MKVSTEPRLRNKEKWFFIFLNLAKHNHGEEIPTFETSLVSDFFPLYSMHDDVQIYEISSPRATLEELKHSWRVDTYTIKCSPRDRILNQTDSLLLTATDQNALKNFLRTVDVVPRLEAEGIETLSTAVGLCILPCKNTGGTWRLVISTQMYSPESSKNHPAKSKLVWSRPACTTWWGLPIPFANITWPWSD